MAKVAPKIVILEEGEDEETVYLSPSSRPCLDVQQYPAQAGIDGQAGHSAEDLEVGSSLSRQASASSTNRREATIAKIARTATFVRRLAQRHDEGVQGRNELMQSLKFNHSRPMDVRSSCSTPPPASLILAHETEERREQRREWLRDKKARLKRALRLIRFNPMNTPLHCWLLVVTLTVLYNAFVLIVRQTFTQLQDEGWKLGIWLLLDYTADTLYIIDMIIQSRTSYIDKGLLVKKAPKMLIHYIKSRAFKLDVASLIPFDFLYIIPAIGPGYLIVRLNRLLRFHRVFQFFHQEESRTNYPNVLRIINLLMYLSLFIHWNACFYFLISKGIGFGSDEWVYPNTTLEGYDSLSRQYLFSLYWSTLTLTTIGELPGPVIEVEYLFVIFDFLAGVLIFATIIGLIGGIISNMNIRKTHFQHRLDNIKQYMRYRNVDKALQRRVIKWFNYLWTNNQSLDEASILESLPDKLHAEIAIHVHFETLQRVKIFEQCEASFLEELVLKLAPQVYSPGDFVCRKGDVGKEMYIIKKGKLEVLGDNNETVATLSDGSYFGEISILNIKNKAGNRRTANVRSLGYSDLFRLSKADLLEVLEEYPDARSILERKAEETLQRYGSTQEPEEEEETPIDGEEGGAQVVKEETNMKLKEMEQKMRQLKERLNSLVSEYNTFQAKIKQRVSALEDMR